MVGEASSRLRRLRAALAPPAAPGLWLALVSLAVWVRWSSPWALLVGAAATLPVVILFPPKRTSRALGAVLLLVGVLSGFVAEWHLGRIARLWPELSASRLDHAMEEMESSLADLVARGISAGDSVAAVSSRVGGPPLFSALDRIRSDVGFDAVLVQDSTGALSAWSGTHHGPLPDGATLSAEPFQFGSGPLFRYLYFATPVPATGGLAVAAKLLAADLPPGLGDAPEGFAYRFERSYGYGVRVGPPDRVGDGAVLDLRWEDVILFSTELIPPTEAEYRGLVALRWQRWVAALMVLAWLLLGTASFGEAGVRRGAAVSLLAFATILPLGSLLGVSAIFDPTEFLLPGPFSATLGRVVAIGLAVIWAAGFYRGRIHWPVLPPPAAGALGAALLLGCVLLVREGAAGGAARWSAPEVFGFQFLLVMLGAICLRPVLSGGEIGAGDGRRAVGISLLVALALCVVGMGLGRLELPLTAAWILLAGVPIGFAARGTGQGWGRWMPSGRLALSVALAGLALGPFVWSDWIDGRRREVEDGLSSLGAAVDPYQQFLLARWAEVTDSLGSEGLRDIEVLYRGWIDSGLAREGWEVDLTVWTPGRLPATELRIGTSGRRARLGPELLDSAALEAGPIVRRVDQADAHYVGIAPLPGGEVATAVLPPRRRLAARVPLSPLLTPGDDLDSPLTLVPSLPGEQSLPGSAVFWRTVEGGLRAETRVPFPEGDSHASFFLAVPGAALLLARGTLTLAADLLILLGLWSLGGLMAGGPVPGAATLRRVSGSFRARVTMALFLFFLLPTSLLGTFAFRSLSSVPQLTASVLAERAAETGARAFFDLQGELEPLSQRAGSDLLLFQGGTMVLGSSPDLLALGLYEGVLPRDVHDRFERGEALLTSAPAHLGRWDYVLAFRRVAGDRILAAPASIRTGTGGLLPLEIGELLGFALLLGAALSLALALLVGRALARPLHTLLVASERVGEGNLSVRLPGRRPDEFGAVFSAFNRMVRRLGTAREELVRTTRRTEAIVEEAAAGVVALDQEGQVTLANPRAATLLGAGLEVGRPLPDVEGPPGEVAAWVGRYFRDGLVEATGEFQFAERRIRIRARRISREGPMSGAVMILEDVTDELRSERVLAWGQMARQVAHEVKNPLTPMKLSIQHVRRAWLDGRPDFGEILDRNAEAVLREIDRLAGISSSFARLAPPDEGPRASLEPVRVDSVVGEVLALYSAGDGSIRFEGRVEPSTPPVLAREAEFKEVLINLLENSRAALDDQGVVEISARVQGDEVEITVRDDGAGIPEDLLPRIFEPHFSTRTGGTGLGLAIVDRLVRSWGGSVFASSDAGAGTVIHLVLPVASAGTGRGPAPA